MSTNLPAPHSEEPSAVPVPITAGSRAQVGYLQPPAPLEEESTLDPRRILDALVRHKWLILAMFIVGGGVGVVASRFQSPVYMAQATIWVEVAPGPRGPIQQGQLLENTNWVDLLRSYTVLDSVVKEQRLFVAPVNPVDSAVFRDFNLKERFRAGAYELRIDAPGRTWELAVQGGEVIRSGETGDSIGSEIGFVWAPSRALLGAGRNIRFRVTTPRATALSLNGRLQTVLATRDGNFMRLTLTGFDPVGTAAALNSIAEQFVRVAAELKREKLTELSRILNEQLEQAAIELRRAEVALESFRVATITEPSDAAAPPVAAGLQQTQAPALSSFFAMKTESDMLRRDREAIQQVLGQPPEAISAVTLEAIGAVQGSSELMALLADLTTRQASLRALRVRYTEDNPQVSRSAEEVTTLQRVTIPAMLRSLIDEIRTREGQLNTRLEVAQRDLRQIPTRTIEEARLRREVSIADALYTTLQARYSEARLAEASSIPDVRILDPAVVPDRPVSDISMLFVLGGLGGGLAVGLGLAILLDRLDRRLRYPDQVTRELGLTILGAVPRVDSNGGRGEGTAMVVEALRSIRLNLVNAYGSAGPLITTITSPGSGDGKSFVASNLALAFADAGHRTLLIDADIRRGTLHRALHAQRKPGLLDYLGGQSSREDVVQKTRIAAVDFIGCGTRKMGGPELLASPAMSQLLLGLRAQYSVIILDSAPLGAGVDPLVLGTLTGSLLLVLRTGVTDKDLASARLTDLDRLPIRILGAVLNDVKPSGVYRYYSYLPGYHSEDEAEAAAPGPRLGAGAT